MHAHICVLSNFWSLCRFPLCVHTWFLLCSPNSFFFPVQLSTSGTSFKRQTKGGCGEDPPASSPPFVFFHTSAVTTFARENVKNHSTLQRTTVWFGLVSSNHLRTQTSMSLTNPLAAKVGGAKKQPKNIHNTKVVSNVKILRRHTTPPKLLFFYLTDTASCNSPYPAIPNPKLPAMPKQKNI